MSEIEVGSRLLALELALQELRTDVLKTIYAERTGKEFKSRSKEPIVQELLKLEWDEKWIKRVLDYLSYQRELTKRKGGVFLKFQYGGTLDWLYSRISSLERKEEYPLIRLKTEGTSYNGVIPLVYIHTEEELFLNELLKIDRKRRFVYVDVPIYFEEKTVVISDAKRYKGISEFLLEELNLECHGFDFDELSPEDYNSLFSGFLSDLEEYLKGKSRISDLDSIGRPIITIDKVKISVEHLQKKEYRGIRVITLEGEGQVDDVSHSVTGLLNHQRLQKILADGGKIIEIEGTFKYDGYKYRFSVGVHDEEYPKLIIEKMGVNWRNIDNEVREFRRVYSEVSEIFKNKFFILGVFNASQ